MIDHRSSPVFPFPSSYSSASSAVSTPCSLLCPRFSFGILSRLRFNDLFESPPFHLSILFCLLFLQVQPHFIGLPDHDSSRMAAPVPEIISRYHFQVDLRGRRLPVTITIPIMPDSSESLSEDSLRPSRSIIIIPDNDPHDVDSETAIQQPQGVVTDPSSTNSEPLETNSCVEGLDLLSHLSVSVSLCCALTI